MSNIPRKEYPRPQFVRENWMNLNGTWAFEIDNGRSGEARGLQKVGTALSGEITVPFCPESELSGVQHTDFMYGVWYKRTVTVTEKQLKGRAVLHFGAVDYCTKVFVNGELAGTHKGGYVSFEFDVTALLKAGENEIAVYAEDNTRDRLIPSGKQSEQYNSYGCFYTRTTGIWQTVWLEFTPKAYISRVQYYPNITAGTVTVTAELVGTANLTATASFEGKEMGSYTAENACGTHTFTIKLSEKHLWDVGCGNLYDVAFAFGEDNVTGYFGLREVRLDGHKFRINGRSVFQRLVLDQGFYPDGIYTAPSDEALDPTRPCIDTSGNYHVATDIFCVHDYEQNPEIFKEHYDKLMTEGTLFDNHAHRQTYKGEATFVSEYGGIQWSQDESGWGYGTGPKTEEEFLTRFKGLTDALLDNSEMFGLCYTQLTDVEQEQNGLYTYQRKPKFDPAFFHGVLSRKAAIED